MAHVEEVLTPLEGVLLSDLLNVLLGGLVDVFLLLLFVLLEDLLRRLHVGQAKFPIEEFAPLGDLVLHEEVPPWGEVVLPEVHIRGFSQMWQSSTSSL